MKSTVLLALIPLITPIFADVWADPECYAKSDVDVGGGKVYEYQSSGHCKQQCVGKRIAALIGGDTCVCGNVAPSSKKVDLKNCNIKCIGYPEEVCGGSKYYTVYVNRELDDDEDGDNNDDDDDDDDEEGASKSKGNDETSSSSKPASTRSTSSQDSTTKSSDKSTTDESSSIPQTTVLSTVTSGDEPLVITKTIYHTPSSTTKASSTNSESEPTASDDVDDSSDKNKLSSGGIAGAVVGAVGGLGLIIGLIFLFLRYKRKKDEDDFDDLFTLSGPKNDMVQPPSLSPNPFLFAGGYNFDTSQQQQQQQQHQQQPLQHSQLQPTSRVTSTIYGHDYKNSSSGGSAADRSYNDQSDVGYVLDPNYVGPGSPPYPYDMTQPELGKRKLSAGSLPDMIAQPGGLKVVNN